jgi:hypothetical protein
LSYGADESHDKFLYAYKIGDVEIESSEDDAKETILLCYHRHAILRNYMCEVLKALEEVDWKNGLLDNISRN